ncbi:hypothetical protein ACTOVN_05920 [Arcanobacterium canis]
MERSELRVHVGGALKNMDARATINALNATLDLLQAVGGNEEYTINHLEDGSAIADIGAPSETVTAVETGLSTLTERAEIPSGWTTKALDAVVKLHDLSKKAGISYISIGTAMPTQLTSTLAENAKTAKMKNPVSLGSATGRIYRYANSSGKPEISLRDKRSGKTMKVLLDNETAAIAVENVEKTVMVRGSIERDVKTNEIVLIKASTITQVDTTIEVPPASRYRGILKTEWLGSKSAVELIREARSA